MLILFRFFYLIFIVSLSSCTQLITPYEKENRAWTHLELGAGNYGEEGHTKKSQRKTVLRELTYVSKAPNYVDQLPENDPHPYDPAHQYAVLFWTLDNLVIKKGPKGIFHVNDLFEDYAQSATKHLLKYAKQRGYEKIIIEPLAGDYMKISSQQTLEKYGFTYYDSIHLKNPEISFYHYGMDGDIMLCNEESRKKARIKLQFLANLSEEGLYYFSPEVEEDFIPKIEREEFIGLFYMPTTQWEPVPYYFPEGQTIDKEKGRVYFIKSQLYSL